MYSQSFTPKALFTCTSQSERRNFGLSKNEYIESIAGTIGMSLTDGTYTFEIKKVDDLYMNNQPTEERRLCQELILRKLYRNIHRIYNVRQANRNNIVKQIITLFSEDVPMWVARFDVHHFYESIDRNIILGNLVEGGRLNYQSLQLMRNLFANPVVCADNGLPRGLGISSVMSELFMKYFDLNVRKMNGVYYYARFVDDIIVFCSSKKARDKVWIEVPTMLLKLGLKLNTEKSYTWEPETDKIVTYLGYTFTKNKIQEKNVIVSIAQKKANVIKTRITRSLVRYSKDGNFDMLKLRIKYLTGNFTLFSNSTLLPIRVGIFYNYRFATDYSVLQELDKYYQKILHCRNGRLGARIHMSQAQCHDLEKYSFAFGYSHKVVHHFTVDQMTKIKKCWV